MNRKFIVNNGELKTGIVENHSDLVIGFDDTKVTGGGWWHLDKRKSVIYLYSSSELYGQASLEDVRKAVESGYLTGFQKTFKYVYSTHESLSDALEDCVKLERKK